MKYYAVRAGRQTGVFTSWADCEAQVKGFAGAKFKSFGSEAEALAFVNGDKPAENRPECEAYAYTDGSFNDQTGCTGGGGILVCDGKEHQFLVCTDKTEADYNEMRNVGGEILAAMAAIGKAKELGIKSLCIYHDYEGIGAWVSGDWKANKPATKAYAQFVRDCDIPDIRFIHVTAHSGIEGNENADELAKYAVGLASGELRSKYPNMQWVAR